jgi:hypothetical protein
VEIQPQGGEGAVHQWLPLEAGIREAQRRRRVLPEYCRSLCQGVGGGASDAEPERRLAAPLSAPSLAVRADPSPQCKSTGGGGWVQTGRSETAAGCLEQPQ